MALVNCTDCGTEVSSRAAACPKCGGPIGNEAQAAGARLYTTQETSKTLKGQQLVAAAIVALGVVLAWAGGSEAVGLGALITAIGFTMYVVTRFKVWWHHK